MARIARSTLPASGMYHVTARGVAQGDIFLDDDDRHRFVRMLQRVARRSNWRCPAYTLMTNHYHAIIDCDLENLSTGMAALNGSYAHQFNEKYTRVGHLSRGDSSRGSFGTKSTSHPRPNTFGTTLFERG
jgi:REP element-mobilizing transposase RayT